MPLDVPMASFVPCIGAGAWAMFGASFGITAAFFLATASYVGWQSSITGGSYWEGFSSFITDNWSETLAITSATYIAAMSIRLANSPKCFKEGTLVQTENGLKPIEEIQVGDKVLAYNEQTGEQAYKPVLRLFRNTSREWTGVSVNGEEIISTPKHKYYLPESNSWKSAEELKVGTKVLLSDGSYGTIEAVKAIHYDEPETTYNFEVEDFHTYYVTESNVLVHNLCKYFEATRTENGIEKGQQITKKQALSRVRNGKDVLTNSRASAKSLAKNAFGNSKIYSEIHNELINPMMHFHDVNNHVYHIFFGNNFI